MKIKYVKDDNKLYITKEDGIPVNRFFDIFLGPEDDVDFMVSKLYLSVKDEVMEYFDLIWGNRNSPVNPTVKEEPIFITKKDKTKEFLRNKKTVIPNFHIESDTYVEDYKAYHGVEPEDYVKPLSPRDEPIIFEGFNFIPSKVTRLETNIPDEIYKGDIMTFIYSIYDQYDVLLETRDVEHNIDFNIIGEYKIYIKSYDLVFEKTIKIIERPLTDLEKMQILMADMIGTGVVTP